MPGTFFPHLLFAWAFVAVLLVLLAAASYIDTRTMKVPKKLTLSALATGLIFNLIRGLWVGGQGGSVWLFGANGAIAGAIDGVLFAIAGAALGFVLFFAMWLLGACGGGDVKLYAAVGAWIGPLLSIYVLIVTIPVILVILLARSFIALPGGLTAMRKLAKPQGKAPAGRRLLAFSLPVTLATLLVLLWVFRVDLKLVPPAPPAHAQVQGGTHAQ